MAAHRMKATLACDHIWHLTLFLNGSSLVSKTWLEKPNQKHMSKSGGSAGGHSLPLLLGFYVQLSDMVGLSSPHNDFKACVALSAGPGALQELQCKI